MDFILYKSGNENKKYVAVWVVDRKPITAVHFGDNRYNDYILYNEMNDKEAKTRKKLYLKRALNIRTSQGLKTHEQPLSPNFWAVHILWNKKTLKDSIKDTEKKFNINILDKTNKIYDKKTFNYFE